MLWDLNDEKHLYTLEHKGIVNALCFSPNRYWLCAATGPSIKIWVSGFLNKSSNNSLTLENGVTNILICKMRL